MKKIIIFSLLLIISQNCFSAANEIRIEGDYPAYTPWALYHEDGMDHSYVVNDVQEMGHVPNFSSYIVLGNDHDWGTNLWNRGAGAAYILSGLPSTDKNDYVILEMNLRWFTSDIERNCEADGYPCLLEVLTRETNGTCSSQTLSEEDEAVYVSTKIDAKNNLLASSSGEGYVEYMLQSYSEAAIDYISVNYETIGMMSLHANNIPSVVPREGGTYSISLINTGDRSQVYSLSESYNWVYESTTSGTLNNNSSVKTIDITFLKNTSTSARSGNIHVVNSPHADIIVSFSQERGLYPADLDLLDLSNIPAAIPYKGGTYSVRVKNTGEIPLNWYTQYVPNWIRVSPASQDDLTQNSTRTVTLTVAENTVTQARNVEMIKFINGANTGDYEGIPISQQAAPQRYTVSGHVTALGTSAGVTGVKINLSGSSSASANTDSYGSYSFTGLLSGNYRVTPVLEGHDFTPAYTDISVNNDKIVNFEDETQIVVSGKVTFIGYNCPISDVRISKNGQNTGWITDSQGKWSGTVTIGENFYLQSESNDLSFDPGRYPETGSTSLMIDQNNIDFKVTDTYALSLKAETNCGTALTGVDITVGTVCGCIADQTYSVNSQGIVSPALDLPPIEYTVSARSLEHPEWFNDDDVVFSLSKDTTLTFTPLTDVILDLMNIPLAYTEDNSDSLYYIHSGDSLALTIRAVDTEGCPAKNVLVTIVDAVADKSDSPVTVRTNDDGLAVYYLVGGEPNYGDPEHSKSLSISCVREPYSVNEHNFKNFSIVVTGEKLVTESFVTGLPEIPLKILHDPCGDNSYSFMQEETEYSQSVSIAVETSQGAEVQTRVGFNIFGIGADIEGAIATSLTNIHGQSWGITMSSLDRKTSSVSTDAYNKIGPGKGDVYIGIGMNILYGLGKEIRIENGTALMDTSLFWQPSYNAATYIYTADEIQNSILTQDCNLLELYDNDSWEYTPQNTRERWENVLNMNMGLDNEITQDELEYTEHVVTYTLDGAGGTIDHEDAVKVTNSRTISTETTLNSSIAAGLHVGFADITCTFDISFGQTSEVGSELTETETVGYHIEDDDEGDKLCVECYRDLVFGTLLFISRNSTTSSPWEDQTSASQGVGATASGDQLKQIKTNSTAAFLARVSNLNINDKVDNQFRLFSPPELNEGHLDILINNKPEDNVTIAYQGNVEIGLQAEYGAAALGDTTIFGIVAQALNDDQISDTVYYTIIWEQVIPEVEFLSETDPFGYDISDTLDFGSETAYIWGCTINGEYPDSVMLKYRFAGNINWIPLELMDEISVSGAPEKYYRTAFKPESSEDTLKFEFRMEAYRNNSSQDCMNCYSLCVLPHIVNIYSQTSLPQEFVLAQNYPNPFNPSTHLVYGLPEACRTSLSIYDVYGKLIEYLEPKYENAGWHEIVWNGHDHNGNSVPAGVYIYTIRSETMVKSQKMLFLK